MNRVFPGDLDSLNLRNQTIFKSYWIVVLSIRLNRGSPVYTYITFSSNNCFHRSAQAFGKVWREGLDNDSRKMFPRWYYISDKAFRMKQVEVYSELEEIQADLPWDRVLGSISPYYTQVLFPKYHLKH